jgi:hypothetical protein
MALIHSSAETDHTSELQEPVLSSQRRYGAFRDVLFRICICQAVDNLLTVTKGLMDAEERHGFEGEGFSYLKNPIWWGGILSCATSSIYPD